MVKWEYLIEIDDYKSSAAADTRHFSELGEQGWELVSTETHPNYRRFYFKRQRSG